MKSDRKRAGKSVRAVLVIALAFFVAFGMTACGSGGGSGSGSAASGSQTQSSAKKEKSSDKDKEKKTETEKKSESETENASGNTGTPKTTTASAYVTISIDCKELCGKESELKNSAQAAHIKKTHGWILKPTKVSISSSDTVYSVLGRITKARDIQMRSDGGKNTFHTEYVKSIDNLREFDAGDQSGWMYSVNGDFPQTGCSAYKVKSGDEIRWRYTLRLGEDL